ncbi:DUF4442 domain-containing protein [Vibrio coralliilyticus]|uniref:PaaI family thioesterase n=1 Tax=Vibrio TaxID=662 RepID=UPI0009E0AA92|nr:MULTISPECIES: DUF4442 domain-containing protein [Vibrio]NOI20515.1 DUF4442 domain-containing protein [Vibrio coralliilyticus]
MDYFPRILLAFFFRYLLNWFPAYRRAGARIRYLSSDFMCAQIELPCSWRTMNHYGFTWGGGIYAAIDPVYAVMLFKVFNGKYKILDKTAEINFLKPATSTLNAKFKLTKRRIDLIKSQVEKTGHYQCVMNIKLEDENGNTCAICKKVISIKRH